MMEMNLGALFAGVAAFGWNTVFRGRCTDVNRNIA